MPKESSVDKPSLTPVFLDAAWINFDPKEQDAPPKSLYDPLGASFTPSTTEGMPRVCIMRHGDKPPKQAPSNRQHGTLLPGANNFGFVDGHADLVKLQNFWRINWHLAWKGQDPPP